MTLQETLDHVLLALNKQGRPSVDSDNLCKYLGESGAKCAAGHCIPDEKYRPGLEGYNLHEILVSNLVEEAGHDIDLVANLQRAHDGAYDFARRQSSVEDMPVAWLKEFNRRVETLAQDWGLKFKKQLL